MTEVRTKHAVYLVVHTLKYSSEKIDTNNNSLFILVNELSPWSKVHGQVSLKDVFSLRHCVHVLWELEGEGIFSMEWLCLWGQSLI